VLRNSRLALLVAVTALLVAVASRPLRAIGPAAIKPADASQHGWIYLRTASAPTVIVVTDPRMHNPKDPSANPEPVPVPTSLDEFAAGWTSPVDIDQWIRARTANAKGR
jgi:hypothetical protein